jgi:hypothetical protein
MQHRVQRVVKNVSLTSGRRYVARMLLMLALVGCLFGFAGTRQSVAAAGWNHFIDPVCLGSMHGSATPGFNWYSGAAWNYAKVQSTLYFYTIYGWQIQDQKTSGYVYGSSGDLRYFLEGNSNSVGRWQGEVVYWSDFAGNATYSEDIYSC